MGMRQHRDAIARGLLVLWTAGVAAVALMLALVTAFREELNDHLRLDVSVTEETVIFLFIALAAPFAPLIMKIRLPGFQSEEESGRPANGINGSGISEIRERLARVEHLLEDVASAVAADDKPDDGAEAP